MFGFNIGDRVRAIRDMDYKYFYAHNPGNKANGIIIPEGSLGVVVDTHVIGGDDYPYVCVDFSLTGRGGSWYVHTRDIVKEIV
jgi:hypothetical protein